MRFGGVLLGAALLVSCGRDDESEHAPTAAAGALELSVEPKSSYEGTVHADWSVWWGEPTHGGSGATDGAELTITNVAARPVFLAMTSHAQPELSYRWLDGKVWRDVAIVRRSDAQDGTDYRLGPGEVFKLDVPVPKLGSDLDPGNKDSKRASAVRVGIRARGESALEWSGAWSPTIKMQ